VARAHFLAAQANLALGKYKDAVNAIEQGMRRRPDWPKADFNPRKELYKGNEPDFVEHLERLQEAQMKSPDNPTYLFLYAYALWFDGRQAEAVPLFRRARAKTADTTYIDAFLKAAPGGVLAVR
jgi:cytochrome c-type biogenesis protein CcmH/NrfG